MDHGTYPWFNQSRGRPAAGMDSWRAMYPQPAPHHYGYGYFQNWHPRGGHHPWPPDHRIDYYSHAPANPSGQRDWGHPASRNDDYDKGEASGFRSQSSLGFHERYAFHENAPRENYGYGDYYSEQRPAGAQDCSTGAMASHADQWVMDSYSGYGKQQTTGSIRRPTQANTQSWYQNYDGSMEKSQAFSSAELSTLSQYRDSGMSSSSYELSQYMHDPTDGSDSWRNMPEGESSVCTPHPTAPLKFCLPHVSVCFGARGQLIRVCPNFPDEGQPALVEIHSMEVILHDTVEQEEMRRFPGPMQREDLHKVDVINFCQENASQCLRAQGIGSRDDALLWQMLLQMCRQNGCLAGSDVAELLLQDGKRGTYRMEQANANLINLNEDPPLTSVYGQVDLLTGATQFAAETSDQAVKKFTKLLFHGQKKDALDWAMKTELWGHALFLSSKLDARTYSWVMGRFTSTLALNDPLLTLFQLMAGRVPQVASCGGDTKWGDWRPHLAVILSNQMGDSEIYRSSIITMGDNLVLKGLTAAGHCCYLTVAIPFGHYHGKADRLVLLGSNHSQSFLKFANSLSIQRTEILEFCQSLRKPGHCIPEFQVYKLIYATRLLDYGLTSIALHYCECIANAILTHSGSMVLISELIKLAERLRYSDPRILDSPELEQEQEPKWLVQLKCLLGQLKGSKEEKHDDGEELTSDNKGTIHVNAEEGRQPTLPNNAQIQEAGFTEPTTVPETWTGGDVSEPQNLVDELDPNSVTPQYALSELTLPQIKKITGTRRLSFQTPINEFIYYTYGEAQTPDETATEQFLQPNSTSASDSSTQPLFALRRASTMSEASTVSVEEDDDGNGAQEDNPEKEERKKASSFGWFSWFRSKPTKEVAQPSERTSPPPQKEELPPPPPSSTLSYPHISQPLGEAPPKNQVNMFSTSAVFRKQWKAEQTKSSASRPISCTALMNNILNGMHLRESDTLIPKENLGMLSIFFYSTIEISIYSAYLISDLLMCLIRKVIILF
uniref:SEC16 homolog B, endoplasmic reticulum export factor n=1 Tax=Leptobrachium leishanense TaxID=445787 RepID=A0A8C5Q7J5_9ANUR